MVAFLLNLGASRLSRRTLGIAFVLAVVGAMLIGSMPSGTHLAPSGTPAMPIGSDAAASALAAARTSLSLGKGPTSAVTPSATGGGPGPQLTAGALGTPWNLLYNYSQPSARATPAMAYDPAAHAVIYFGGGWNLGQSGNDTWTFAGGNWTNISATLSVAPGPRDGAVMTYDAADQYIVLFGGFTNSFAGAPNTSWANGSYALADTWSFQWGYWTNITSLSPAAPPARFMGAMTYDYTDGYAVLFGGDALNGTLFNDTWTFSGGVWNDISASVGTAPAGRSFAAMADDPSDGYVVLFGGWDSINWTIFNDTWTFSAGSWTLLPAASAPLQLRGAAMAYDAARTELVLFGGATYGYFGPIVPQAETWTFAAGAWTDISSTIASAPPARFSAGITNISSSGSLLMADGCLAAGCFSYVDISDGWLYNASGPIGRAWIPVGESDQPSQRATPAMAYDAVDHYVLYFGGGWNVGESVGDTWTFANGTWTNITANLTSAPSPRENALMTYDAGDEYVLLFGGYTDNGHGGIGSYTLHDTWKFTAGAWTNITAFSSTAPPPRFMGAMTYDYTDGYALLFGGDQLGYNAMADTWTFSTGNWTDITTSSGPAPPPRNFASLTDDPADGYLLLFGGWDSDTHTVYGDTWTFSHGAWTQVTTPVAPVPLRGAMVAYEAVGGYVLLYGGVTYSSPGWPFGLESETWMFSGGNWTNLTPYITTEPPARFSAGITNISDTGSIVMADGCLGQGCIPFEDLANTWIFNWTSINGTLGLAVHPTPLDPTASFAVTAVGGNWAYHYAYDGLPVGCTSIDSASLTCVPIGAGTYSVGVLVSDTAGRTLALSVNLTVLGEELSIAAVASVPELDLGQPVVLTAAATGGAGAPWTFGYLALPPGCTSQNSASLSCTPAQSGTFHVIVTVTDASGRTATTVVAVLVHPAVVVSALVSASTIDLSESITMSTAASYGSAVYHYVWSNLPAGCSLPSGSTVQCTPTTVGTWTISAGAIDTLGQSAMVDPIGLTVNPVPTVQGLATVGGPSQPLSVDLVADLAGGTAPFEVAWVFGDGLTGSGLSVSHTYGAGGTYAPQVFVNDSRGFSASWSVEVTVQAPAIVHTPLPHIGTSGGGGGAWYDAIGGEFGLGVVFGLLALAMVGIWAARRRRALADATRFVEDLRSPAPTIGSSHRSNDPADRGHP